MKKISISLIVFFNLLFLLNLAYAQTTLNNCTTLSTNSETYILNQDIFTNSNCFELTADNIILNCNNHLITGPGENTGSSAIRVSNKNNITLDGCRIYNFTKGFELSSLRNSKVINSEVINSSFGFYITSSNNNSFISNQVFSKNGWGFSLDNSRNNLLSSNILENAGTSGFGFFLDTSSNNNHLESNKAKKFNYNFYFSDNSNNEIRSNTALKGRYGFYSQATNNTYSMNDARENREVNYFFWVGSTDEFKDINYAFSNSTTTKIMQINSNAVIKAEDKGKFSLIVTDHLTFTFKNATNLELTSTSELGRNGISATRCNNTNFSCFLSSNILILNTTAPNTKINELTLFYDSNGINQNFRESELGFGNYQNGWINRTNAYLNTAGKYIVSKEELTISGIFGVVAFKFNNQNSSLIIRDLEKRIQKFPCKERRQRFLIGRKFDCI